MHALAAPIEVWYLCDLGEWGAPAVDGDQQTTSGDGDGCGSDVAMCFPVVHSALLKPLLI